MDDSDCHTHEVQLFWGEDGDLRVHASSSELQFEFCRKGYLQLHSLPMFQEVLEQFTYLRTKTRDLKVREVSVQLELCESKNQAIVPLP